MRSSWADLAANSAAENNAPSSATNNSQAPTRPAYVPPHLRNRPPSHHSPAESSAPPPAAAAAPRWGAPRDDYRSSGPPRWGGNRGGRDREVNPFDDVEDVPEEAFGDQENTGINFDAYEDIPVETSGGNVPPPVNTFAEIDLGDALNENIRRCKYTRPTPVQRHAIPISLAGRDLMACAQTGSGKTAAFCFPIISGIMTGQPAQRPPRGVRTVYPLALVLSPTRELSMQVSFGLLFAVLGHAFFNWVIYLKCCHLVSDTPRG